jgi:hypothetical protein
VHDQEGLDMSDQHAADTAALVKRVEELEARLAQMTTAAPRSSVAPTDDGPATEATTSRRGLLKLAGATAVGAAATSLLAAAPAAATDGGSLVIGADNLEEAATLLRYDGSSAIGSTNLLTVYDYEDTLSGADNSVYPATVAGWAIDGPAGVGSGVYGYTVMSGGYGTVGRSAGDASSHGVLALSSGGYGLVAGGALAPIQMTPASSAGAPTSGAHQLGELYVDSHGTMYRCVVAGTPGSWAPLNSVVPLASPVRVVDTRDGTGGITGPLTASTTATSSNLTGSFGIPASAIAVVGTVTLVATGANLPGAGFLTVFPGGAAVPSTSNVNADTGHAIASGATVGLGTGGNTGKVSFNASFAAHALLDVAAYII